MIMENYLVTETTNIKLDGLEVWDNDCEIYVNIQNTDSAKSSSFTLHSSKFEGNIRNNNTPYKEFACIEVSQIDLDVRKFNYSKNNNFMVLKSDKEIWMQL